jgi:hypothetical protein
MAVVRAELAYQAPVAQFLIVLALHLFIVKDIDAFFLFGGGGL